MRVFFSSDHHFFHSNIIKYCERPYRDSDHMNSELIRLWNEVVGPEDFVFYLGDLSAGLKGREEELRDVIHKLNGSKVLIRGNHDHQEDSWYLDSGFLSVFPHVNLGGVLLTHYPLQNLVQQVDDLSILGEVEFILHGHVHRKDTPEFESHFNVAAERHGFKPVEVLSCVPEPFLQKFFLNFNKILTDKNGGTVNLFE